MLFENKTRSDNRPKSYVESDWDYLDRSGRATAQRVRDFLNYWITAYPESDRGDLISRITSRDCKNFKSATFELILFALLKSLGCKVEIHPESENGSGKHPDFLAVTPKGESVYIEAVLASEYSESEVSAQKRTDVVLNTINKIDSPNFFVGVKVEGHPERPPKGRDLRKKLTQWLSSLDPDTVALDMEDSDHTSIPSMTWEKDGWRINFEAIPKKPEYRGQGQSAIGMLSTGARWINVWEPIRDAIKTKGGRYHELPHPLLIAINVDAMSLDRIDEMQGLYGQEEVVIDRNDLSATPQMSRKANGAWFGYQGPQYTRVSGAWIFESINPWNIVSRRNTFYFNPWATKSVPALFESLDHAKAKEEKMAWIEGRTLSQILSLSPEWPE